MCEQKMKDVFDKRQNQIVIEHVYKKMLWNRLVVRLVVYLIFVILATVLAIHETTKDNQSAFFFHQSLQQKLVEDEFSYNISKLLRTYENIDDKGEFFFWLRGPFLDVFYPQPTAFWDRSNTSRRDLGFVDKQARLLGVPRLRMIRSELDNCDVPGGWSKVDSECFTAATQPDSAPFGPNEMWKYNTSDDLDGLLTWGEAGWYPGGGHVVDLPPPTSQE